MAKESVARACSEKAGNLAGYATGMANKPGEDEEEEYAEGNCKKPERNPIGISHGWGNENAPYIGRKAVDIQIKLLSKPIEMQTNFSQETNCHAMWNTTGMKNLTTLKFPRLAVVPYAVI